MELLNNYEMSVHYHSGKANIVADALSRVFIDSMALIDDGKKVLTKEVHSLARLVLD